MSLKTAFNVTLSAFFEKKSFVNKSVLFYEALCAGIILNSFWVSLALRVCRHHIVAVFLLLPSSAEWVYSPLLRRSLNLVSQEQDWRTRTTATCFHRDTLSRSKPQISMRYTTCAVHALKSLALSFSPLCATHKFFNWDDNKARDIFYKGPSFC